MDWREALRENFEAETERCHGGCGDIARVLRLRGRSSGAWCKSCYAEVAYGRVPRLDAPKGLKRPGPNRKTLMQ